MRVQERGDGIRGRGSGGAHEHGCVKLGGLSACYVVGGGVGGSSSGSCGSSGKGGLVGLGGADSKLAEFGIEAGEISPELGDSLLLTVDYEIVVGGYGRVGHFGGW